MPLAHHSISNPCKCFYSIVSKRQTVSFKNFNWLWWARVGLLRASLSLRQMCLNHYLSTFVSTLIKKTDGEQSLWLYCSLLSQFPNIWCPLRCAYSSNNGHKAVLRLASLAAPSASLTHSTNCRWWLFILSPFGA